MSETQNHADELQENLPLEYKVHESGKEQLAKNDINMKYLSALREAEKWKKRYLMSAASKVNQLSNIESNLMILEARLEAEKRDIERKFYKQAKILKEQQRKIEKLTTANHKLLNGLMTLSQNKTNADPSLYHLETKPCKSVKRDEASGSVKDQYLQMQKDDEKQRKSLKNHDHKFVKKTQRSKSLPFNRNSWRYVTSAEC